MLQKTHSQNSQYKYIVLYNLSYEGTFVFELTSYQNVTSSCATALMYNKYSLYLMLELFWE